MIGAEGDAVVSQTQAQSNGGVPAMRAGHLGVIDVVECGRHFRPPVGGDQITFGSNRDPIGLAHAQRQKQRAPALVEEVGEVLGFHDGGV